MVVVSETFSVSAICLPAYRSIGSTFFLSFFSSRPFPQVPLGYKGTITAVHTITDPNPVRLESVRKTDVLYEVLFDKLFDEGNSVENVAEKRFFNVPPCHLLNITQGLKSYNITKPSDNVHQTVANDRKNIWEQLKKGGGADNNKKVVNTEPNVAVPTVIKNDLNLTANSTAASDHDDESDVLRKLLKIQLNKQTEPSTVIQSASYENSTKINVSDLFRVDPAHPPKPPQNWNNQTSNRNKVFPQTDVIPTNSNNSQFYPPPPTTKPNYIHHPRPNSAAHRSPIHNDVINNQVSRRFSGRRNFLHGFHVWHLLLFSVDIAAARPSRSSASGKISTRTSRSLHTVTSSSQYFQVKFKRSRQRKRQHRSPRRFYRFLILTIFPNRKSPNRKPNSTNWTYRRNSQWNHRETMRQLSMHRRKLKHNNGHQKCEWQRISTFHRTAWTKSETGESCACVARLTDVYYFNI